MKKLNYKFPLLVAALATASLAVQAQGSSFYKQSYKSRNSGSFHKSDMLLSFAYGFPNTALNDINTFAKYNAGFGPLYAKFEYGVRDEIGIGISLGAGGAGYKWNGYKGNGFAFATTIQAYYHFNKLIPVSKLDVYAGAGFSFVHRSYNDNVRNNGNSRDNDLNLVAVGLVGARWYFSPKFSVFAEVGNDAISNTNIGVSFKL